FTNTLCIAVLASVAFMFWSLYEHVFTDCLKDWTELWIDTAFWHILFCAILMVIMILWRPSNNNQCYAFTPLLDNSEDENDDDEIFNSDAFVTEAMKLHQKPSETKAENRKQRDPDQALKEELKWVEENIPSSMADKLVADSDEDAEATRFELSKMQ
uniref:Transmembrane protein 87A n=1 Tax=Plectus sambesii TaxID=2011161 RepID=A0A914V187_9BILA